MDPKPSNDFLDLFHVVWAGVTAVFGYLGSKVIGHYDFRLNETDRRLKDTENHGKEIIAVLHNLDKKIMRIETLLEKDTNV